MARENMEVRGVTNIYGVRDTGGTVGQLPSAGGIRELTVDLNVASMTDDLFKGVVIPAGSKVVEVFVKVDEAFTITTGSTAGYVGEEGNEDTNGISLSDTLLEALGISKLDTAALLGTFNDESSYISTDTQVGFDIGTLDPAGTAGKATVVIRYVHIAI